MIKNKFLLILIVSICAIIASNIGASIYASIMLLTDIGFGIIAIGIGYLVGNVIFYVTTKNMEDDESSEGFEIKNEMSLGTLKHTSIFGAFISGCGVLMGDNLYYSYYGGAIDYLDIFLSPFFLILVPIETLVMHFDLTSVYFTSIFSGEDFIWGIMSLVFIVWAMYWGYIFSLGASFWDENE